MNIIKLDATNSTNSFLKDLSQSANLEDFTVVVTKQQTSGRGQMQTKWVSKAGKNLTFSVFCLFDNLATINQKYLSFAVSIAIFRTLYHYKLPKLAIKWPNDILSEKQKICGVLIENSLQKDKITSAIIGIGLNVNQVHFPEDINATSFKIKLHKEFRLKEVLDVLLFHLKAVLKKLRVQNYSDLEDEYLSVLYKKNIPTMFVDSQDNFFMGKIIGVSPEGKLIIELADETFKEFGLKEVSFARL